jgi:hypothetical protein
MFDRTTGAVDPKVIAYWRTHYDLAHTVESTWVQRGPYLKAKIHIYVGTEALIDVIAAQMYLVAYPGAAARWRAVAAEPFP